MNERVKLFTHLGNEGSTLIEPELEEHINDWLRNTKGKIVNISQSECQLGSSTHHTTICVWYEPAGGA